METIELAKGSTLVLVAHPDDETIWMGGTILEHQDVDWTIFSLCREDDPDRMPKFQRACQPYKAKGIISDLDDEDGLTTEQSIKGIKERIRRYLNRKNFDYIFTHGPDGEYGHKRHQEVCSAVRQMLKDRELAAKQVFYFAYQLDKEKAVCQPVKEADFYLKIPQETFRIKRQIIREIYGFSKSSFEDNSCSAIETFNS